MSLLNSSCRGLLVLLVLGVFASGTEARATPLLGVDLGGQVVQIDQATGVATLIGPSGFGANAAASDSLDRMFTSNSVSLILINPVTGAGSVFVTYQNRPSQFSIRE